MTFTEKELETIKNIIMNYIEADSAPDVSIDDAQAILQKL